MDFLFQIHFWLALIQIIIIDILLGGDNAIIIALACRNLPERQKSKGIIYGTLGAIVLRIIFVFCAMFLLDLPFLKIVGAILLFWIALKLLNNDNENHESVKTSDKLITAIKTIILADVVMSLDNVLAISAAAKGSDENQFLLVILGLLISIPIIIYGSFLIIKLMEKFPWIIILGGMLLGWIATSMLISENIINQLLEDLPNFISFIIKIFGAILVFIFAKILNKSSKK